MLINDSINERARVLIEDPDIDFCYGLCSVRDENDKEISTMNSPWPTMDESRISRYLFHTSSPLIRRSTCSKIGLWREDDLGAQEHEYFARLKYFSNKVSFISKILSVYTKHKHENIFDKSKFFWLGIFRNNLSVKGLILYGKYDNKNERNQLSLNFKEVAKQLFRSGDYSNACAALEESMILKWNFKVFAQWFVIKCMELFKQAWLYVVK